MRGKELLTAGEFAELSGITRSNLLYYDAIGILKPELRGENNYRLYSCRQLDLICAVVALRSIGVPLKTIREHIKDRTPEKTLRLMEEQIASAEAEIKKLRRIIDGLGRRADAIRLHKDIKTPLFTLEPRGAERIYAGSIAPSSPAADPTYLHSFIKQCAENGACGIVDQIGQIVFMEAARSGDWDAPGCMYVRTSAGNAEMKEGLYANLYERSLDFFDDNRIYYEKFMKMVADSGLELRGDLYLEYPIDEISENDPQKHLVKIFARVRQI